MDTALGENVLLATGSRGCEKLSNLFSFELDFVAENSTAIDFRKFIGTDVTLKVATPGKGTDQEWRYLSGSCACFSQGDRSETFTDTTRKSSSGSGFLLALTNTCGYVLAVVVCVLALAFIVLILRWTYLRIRDAGYPDWYLLLLYIVPVLG